MNCHSMYSPITRIHWLQLVASVAGWVGGGSRYILSQAHLILAPIVEERAAMLPFLPLMPWQVGGSDVDDGELDVVGTVLSGSAELNSMSRFSFSAQDESSRVLQSLQSEEEAMAVQALTIEEDNDRLGMASSQGGDSVSDNEVYVKPTKIRKTARLRQAASTKSRLAKLLLAWLAIIMIDPNASEAGKFIQDKQTEVERLAVLEAYVAGKAVNTLAARLSSISRFVKFIDGKIEMWPPTIKSSRLFIEKCLVNGAATALQRFLEALVFMVFTFRFGRATLEAGQSLYFQGLANLNLKRLGLRRQAQPIPFHAVATMEAILASGSHSDLTRVIIGGLLFLIYFRARVNDMALIQSITLFDSFVEVDSDGAKTSSKDRLRTTFLAPRLTISGIDFWPIIIELRNNLGIPFEGGALFPALDEEEVWHNHQAVLADILALIRMVCAMCGVENPEMIGTHAGKVTMLAAAVIFGLSKEIRTRLGYHKVAGERSVNSYARDNLVEPIQQMTTMVVAAQRGEFDPLAGRLKKTVNEPDDSLTQPAEVPDEEELEEWLDDPEMEVQAENEHADANLQLVELWSKKCRGDNRLFRHLGTGKTHRGNPDAKDSTACNYLLTASYQRLATSTEMDDDEVLKLCKNCFGRDEVVSRQLARRLSRPLQENLLENEYVEDIDGLL
jgi:hypothetical protein